MDAKITKSRLSGMLSYDWLKIVLGAVALIFVWSLIFTMTATRITPAQQFTVFNYLGNCSFGSTNFNELYAKAFQENVFSYEVLEINDNDLTIDKSSAYTIMEARTATGEGDVIFVADVDNTDTKTEAEDGTVSYEYTYLETLVRRYGHCLYDLNPENENSFFGKMESYLNGFYQGDWTKKENLDKSAVEAQFRARVKKDKRYKTEKQRIQGVADDIDRIEKYRDALEDFYGYLEAGVVSFTTTVFSDREQDENTYYPDDGIYSVNLCPNGQMEGLKKYVGYYEEVTDENGDTHYPITAANMNVAFFHFNEVEEGFQYESLLFVNFIIENSLAETANNNG